MHKGVKVAVGSTLALVVAGGLEFAYLYHKRHAEEKPAATSSYKVDPDDNVYLKHERPDSMKDMKALKGRSLWVSAAGQMDLYPFDGHKADFAHSHGVLLGAEKIVVQDAVEQVTPKKYAFRVPAGERQVLLAFTHGDDPKVYATPVGYFENGTYTILDDQIFFYDDPHQLYAHWGPKVWAAVDAHRAEPGMNERQVQMAYGQVSTGHGDTVGDRDVEFDNQGHPKLVTFAHGKATRIVDETPATPAAAK